jgi:hypothetical protein
MIDRAQLESELAEKRAFLKALEDGLPLGSPYSGQLETRMFKLRLEIRKIEQTLGTQDA